MKPLFLFTVALALGILHTYAQNLVVNPNFAGGSKYGWSTTTNIEVGPTNIYGGPSATDYVAELDVQTSFYQKVCILPALSYTLSYQAMRRPQVPTPTTLFLQVKVTGVPSNIEYINTLETYTNTTWSPQSKTYSITLPANATDKQLNIQFSPYNNTTTTGILIWDIQLAPSASNVLAISGPSTTGVRTPNNFSLSNSPANANYNWSFSNDASQPSSTSATPTDIFWTSLGSKTVSVTVSNSVCGVAAYARAVSISSTLALEWTGLSGVVVDHTAGLSWISQQGADGSYYIVQRSVNGRDFDSVGRVTSSNAATCHYTDRNMPAGKIIYRIVYVSMDHTPQYSSLLLLENIVTIGPDKVRIFPDPVLSVLRFTITGEREQQMLFRIYTSAGIMLMNTRMHVFAGANQQSIPVSWLPAGHYFLNVTDLHGRTQASQTFIKI